MKSVKKAPLVPKKYAGKWVAWNHEHNGQLAIVKIGAERGHRLGHTLAKHKAQAEQVTFPCSQTGHVGHAEGGRGDCLGWSSGHGIFLLTGFWARFYLYSSYEQILTFRKWINGIKMHLLTHSNTVNTLRHEKGQRMAGLEI